MLRSLWSVHRWWMSFLPYRSLSALMIPPPLSVTPEDPLGELQSSPLQALQQFLADLVVLRCSFPEAQRELFPFKVHAERDHERLTASVGPCLGTSRRARRSSRLRSWNCFSCFAVASTRWRDTELGVTPKALPAFVTVSSYLRADIPRSTSARSSSEKPPRFLSCSYVRRPTSPSGPRSRGCSTESFWSPI